MRLKASNNPIVRLFALNAVLIAALTLCAAGTVLTAVHRVGSTAAEVDHWVEHAAVIDRIDRNIQAAISPQLDLVFKDPEGQRQRTMDLLTSVYRASSSLLISEEGHADMSASMVRHLQNIKLNSKIAIPQMGSVLIASSNPSNVTLSGGQSTLVESVSEMVKSSAALKSDLYQQQLDAAVIRDARAREMKFVALALTIAGFVVAVFLAMFGRRLRQNEQVVANQRREDLALIEESAAELRSANKRLAQSNRDLMGFAFVASHDLQEPLRKIVAFGDRLEKRAGAGMDQQSVDYLSRMRGAASRMQRLIEDLLSYSRTATKTGDMAVIQLNPVLLDVVSDLEIAIENSNAQIDLGQLPELSADPTQMRQLFQNLIANAIKFRQAELTPRITIAARRLEPTNPLAERLTLNHPHSGGWWQISVSDNGIGFDQQYADKVFMVFQRLNGRDEYEGSGLGLAVSRRIVERHQGDISVSSTLGVGTTFTIVLPVKQPTVEVQSPLLNRASISAEGSAAGSAADNQTSTVSDGAKTNAKALAEVSQ
jgi:signal transduction histidine kinase